MINLDLTYLNKEIDFGKYQEQASKIHQMIFNKTGSGNDFLGWVSWPNDYNKQEVDEIIELSEKLKGQYDTVLVCGIGGSYLGCRACHEMVKGLYPDNGIEVIYVGNTFSNTYINQVLKHLENKSVILNVISKSGTTTETSISFRIFKNWMEKKYGEEAKNRIFATTDKARGTLKQLADEKGYKCFVIPDDIGGRYSVFTAVGLLPLALAGINIKELLQGSKDAFDKYNNADVNFNDAFKYAIVRRELNADGYNAEMFVTYDLQLTMIAEWWKQLFGESEGKEGLGILPTSACFSTDLHSLGQFIQEGSKCLYETVLNIENMPEDIIFPSDKENLDNMNYLAGKNLKWVNDMARIGTLQAHSIDGNVPNIVINLKDNSAYSFGYMIYFFFISCAATCYMLDINPFNQPGVEVYKKKMFKLLGKE